MTGEPSPAPAHGDLTSAAAPIFEMASLGNVGGGAGLAARFRAAALPANTRAAYAGDWAKFTAWCARTDQSPLPADPTVVGEYLAQAATLVDEHGAPVYAPATLARWVAGINAVHRAAGHSAPGADLAVAAILRGIRATQRRPPHRAKPLRLPQLTAVLDAIETRTWPAAVIGRRDVALLLLGFAGALRRSELAALTVGDIQIEDGDLIARIPLSKTDQDATGRSVGYPRGSRRQTCTACATLNWARLVAVYTTERRVGVLRVLHQDRAGGHRGHICTRPEALAVWGDLVAADPTAPLLRPVTKAATISNDPISGSAVNAVLTRRLAAAGIDPAGYSGHSLRAGFVTDAFTAGATAHEIMRQTRHTTPATLEAYARHYTPLEANAVNRIGL